MSTSDSTDRRYSAPAAACAADTLLALARADGPLTLQDLAEQTGHGRSLLYRTIRMLLLRNFVGELARPDGNGVRYRLGAACGELGGAYQTSIPFHDSIRDTLRTLSLRTGETTSIASLTGTDVLYVMREEGRFSVMSVSQVGKRLPAHATAVGKALLAGQSDEAIRALFAGKELSRYTEQTHTDVNALIDDISSARLRGYAIERSEIVNGRCCVATVIPGEQVFGTPIALSLSMPEPRFDAEIDRLSLEVLAARDILAADARNRALLGERTARDSPVPVAPEPQPLRRRA